jgi:hypothetical protein
MDFKPPPTSPGKEEKSGERYEEPFESQKSQQDKDRETPGLGEEAFHGVIGRIARKVAKETEADGRAILVGLLVGVGNIIGRTAYWRVDAVPKHVSYAGGAIDLCEVQAPVLPG